MFTIFLLYSMQKEKSNYLNILFYCIYRDLSCPSTSHRTYYCLTGRHPRYYMCVQRMGRKIISLMFIFFEYLLCELFGVPSNGTPMIPPWTKNDVLVKRLVTKMFYVKRVLVLKGTSDSAQYCLAVLGLAQYQWPR